MPFLSMLRSPGIYCSSVLLACLLAEPCAAEQSASAADHAVVPGFNRFFGDAEQGGVAGGLLLAGELNCLSCHAAEEPTAALIDTKAAPLLGAVGSRVNFKWLRRFIADPHQAKPGTTMPSLLAAKSAEERNAIAEPLVHYLVSLSEEPFDLYGADGGAVARGEELFHRIGCVACHAPRRGKVSEQLAAKSVPLGALAEKYSIDGLTGFLLDPLHVRPSGRMPSLNLTAAEAGDIAHYLLQQIDAPPRRIVAMNYYEGNWQKLPQFSKLTPKLTAGRSSFELGKLPRKENFAVTLESFLIVAREGDYTFFTTSDDGSQLFVDGKQVVDNDGLHGGVTKQGKIHLSAGRHPIRLAYFQASGPFTLKVEWQPPGGKRSPIAPANLVGAREPNEAFEPLAVDAKLAAKGKELFASVGCASCHQLGGKHRPIASRLEAPALAALKPGEGCLQEEVVAGVPEYRLGDVQRGALSALITRLAAGKLEPRSTAERIDATLTRMNCYACHEREKKGGPVEARESFFTANQKDLGQEGRIPPLLTGTGDKLKRDWLATVLFDAGIVRPYMDTRMPQFGKANIGHLVEDFIVADLTEGEAPATAYPVKDIKTAGRHLVGKQGLSCISCHTFHRFESLGIQTMDLTAMPKRLRRDWFLRYMLKPADFRPGTRMPEAWPGGKTFKKDILGGNTEQQILAVYDYLADGRKAIRPDGLIATGMELIVGGEAMMYRNFIQGAGPRGIAVGHPEQVNLAINADEIRLALLWQGRFMDASKHWSGRSQGFQPPAGNKVISLVGGPPFAVLENEKSAWPGATGTAAGYQFHGYRLDRLRRPTFVYDFDHVQIEDKSIGIEGENKRGIRRTLVFKSDEPVPGLWQRVAAAGNLEQIDQQTFRTGDLTLHIELAEGSEPLLREVGQKELLLPIRFEGDTARVVVEYHW